MIAAYDYYKCKYSGAVSAFSEPRTWLEIERRAVSRLNYLCFGRIYNLSETDCTDNVKMAVCALCDAMYAIDAIKQTLKKNDGNSVSSMSSLGVSVSYSGDVSDLKEAAMDTAKENAYLKNVVREYLQGSGLLYAGI